MIRQCCVIEISLNANVLSYSVLQKHYLLHAGVESNKYNGIKVLNISAYFSRDQGQQR